MSAKLQKNQLNSKVKLTKKKKDQLIDGSKEGLEKVLEDFNKISENNEKIGVLLGRWKKLITD